MIAVAPQATNSQSTKLRKASMLTARKRARTGAEGAIACAPSKRALLCTTVNTRWSL